MAVHSLKASSIAYEKYASGMRKVLVTKFYFEFEVGDRVVIYEELEGAGALSGSHIVLTITDILTYHEVRMPDGYAIISIALEISNSHISNKNVNSNEEQS